MRWHQILNFNVPCTDSYIKNQNELNFLDLSTSACTFKNKLKGEIIE